MPSATNFLAIDCGTPERAGAMLEGMIARGVFVRKPLVETLDRCIRLSVGKPESMNFAIKPLKHVSDFS